jgi:hypothetical protein
MHGATHIKKYVYTSCNLKDKFRKVLSDTWANTFSLNGGRGGGVCHVQ